MAGKDARPTSSARNSKTAAPGLPLWTGDLLPPASLSLERVLLQARVFRNWEL